jgi:hypothetical protein
MKKIFILFIWFTTGGVLAQAQSPNKSTSFITSSYDVNQSILNSKVIWADASTTGSWLQKAMNADNVFYGVCRCRRRDWSCNSKDYACKLYCRGICGYPAGARNDQFIQNNGTSLNDDYPNIVSIR